MRENGLIIKLGLFSKSMSSQPGKESFTIHIFSNISRSKGTQTITFCQLTEYSTTNSLLAENEIGRLVPEQTFFLKKKSLFDVKVSG